MGSGHQKRAEMFWEGYACTILAECFGAASENVSAQALLHKFPMKFELLQAAHNAVW